MTFELNKVCDVSYRKRLRDFLCKGTVRGRLSLGVGVDRMGSY